MSQKNLLALALLFFNLPVQAFATTASYVGKDARGEPCELSLTHNENDLDFIHLSGTYHVKYLIPMPFSGLFGDYYWEGVFDNSLELASIQKHFLPQGYTIKVQAKPIFYDVPELSHWILIQEDNGQPVAASYFSYDPPAVIAKLTCQELTATP